MTILDARGMSVHKGGRLVVDGVSFSASRGEVLALMGPSGTGKTTVLRGIAGLDPLSGGEVHVDGVRLTVGRLPSGNERRALYRRVGMVSQSHDLFAHLTAIENVCLAPVHVLKRSHDDAATRARELLHIVGVGDRAGSFPHELSGGEAQRVAIARALALDPPILLMDEPTASLDEGRREGLTVVLRELASHGRTIILSTHDRGFASSCADRIVQLDAGRIQEASVTHDPTL